jgi:hypothetical protein
MNAGKPMPQTYLVTDGEGYDRVARLVTPAEGETSPGRPVPAYPRVPPSPKR